MNHAPFDPHVTVVATRTNVLALVGFWLAVGGFLTCGVTGIPALVCSILGLRLEPKGFAIAGIALALPSVAWSLFWIVTWTLAFLRMATAP